MRLTLLNLCVFSDLQWHCGRDKNKQWTQISFIVVQAEFALPVKTAEGAAGLHSIYVQIPLWCLISRFFFFFFIQATNDYFHC